ncbi:Transcriptional regulator of nonfermentable carbon utilization [Phlyctochytrium planicorne]|nr:Transcriptional regulator of nonfermentable carbon utilization [Phlyctochytrium planicorne]
MLTLLPSLQQSSRLHSASAHIRSSAPSSSTASVTSPTTTGTFHSVMDTDPIFGFHLQDLHLPTPSSSTTNTPLDFTSTKSPYAPIPRCPPSSAHPTSPPATPFSPLHLAQRRKLEVASETLSPFQVSPVMASAQTIQQQQVSMDAPLSPTSPETGSTDVVARRPGRPKGSVNKKRKESGAGLVDAVGKKKMRKLKSGDEMPAAGLGIGMDGITIVPSSSSSAVAAAAAASALAASMSLASSAEPFAKPAIINTSILASSNSTTLTSPITKTEETESSRPPTLLNRRLHEADRIARSSPNHIGTGLSDLLTTVRSISASSSFITNDAVDQQNLDTTTGDDRWAYRHLLDDARARLGRWEQARLLWSLASLRPTLLHQWSQSSSPSDRILNELFLRRKMSDLAEMVRCSGTPTACWRGDEGGEVVLAGREFLELVGCESEEKSSGVVGCTSGKRRGRLVTDFMDAASVVEYWEAFASLCKGGQPRGVRTPLEAASSSSNKKKLDDDESESGGAYTLVDDNAITGRCTLIKKDGSPVPCAFFMTVHRGVMGDRAVVVGQFLPIGRW